MSALPYGREALRRFRERQESAKEVQSQPTLLEQIPVDAPIDDATITAWDGERFVAWDRWLAHAQIVRKEERTAKQEPRKPIFGVRGSR